MSVDQHTFPDTFDERLERLECVDVMVDLEWPLIEEGGRVG